ncbi:hypothetical protein [Mobiluncus mulieris]|uniref:hypothetical protein n=1 Tax=Mobiluncus mulieris TaxID=2052 RepID=UPI000E015FA1|nr:hypothetical protein [Mobiluncus mulieris]NMW76076.1 hypothetical protein [Mobiluncus mulieris]NMX02261.1 hypothetical protein [Mobiluncus mulieris]STY83243.1 Uncharacterised protein [Mobiluncus mulieris]
MAITPNPVTLGFPGVVTNLARLVLGSREPEISAFIFTMDIYTLVSFSKPQVKVFPISGKPRKMTHECPKR